MTAKEYLQQAFFLDKEINSKLEQLDELNALARKVTTTLSDMPRAKSDKGSRLEHTVLKIVALQEEINGDIDDLVDLKREIRAAILTLEDPEERVILEKRYLAFTQWEQIAVDLNYSIQYCFKVHKRALEKIKVPEKSHL